MKKTTAESFGDLRKALREVKDAAIASVMDKEEWKRSGLIVLLLLALSFLVTCLREGL